MIAKIYSVQSAIFTLNSEQPREIVLVAIGKTSTGGWSSAELAPWTYIREPEDGFT